MGCSSTFRGLFACVFIVHESGRRDLSDAVFDNIRYGCVSRRQPPTFASLTFADENVLGFPERYG